MGEWGTGQHLRVHDLLLGPYVLGGLEPGEEREVEQHLNDCPACREEERGLREAHERLAGAALSNTAVPPHLKDRIFAALPPPDETAVSDGRLSVWPWARRAAVAATLVVALVAAYYAAGLFSQPAAETATLEPTGLAPGARGELEVRETDSGTVASVEVWGLPQPGPREYYELWVGGEGGRVSAGTFTVNADGWGRHSASCADVAGEYQRAGITLEKYPNEPRIDEARVVLGGELRET